MNNFECPANEPIGIFDNTAEQNKSEPGKTRIVRGLGYVSMHEVMTIEIHETPEWRQNLPA